MQNSPGTPPPPPHTHTHTHHPDHHLHLFFFDIQLPAQAKGLACFLSLLEALDTQSVFPRTKQETDRLDRTEPGSNPGPTPCCEISRENHCLLHGDPLLGHLSPRPPEPRFGDTAHRIAQKYRVLQSSSYMHVAHFSVEMSMLDVLRSTS